jgi:hypothetical protein
VKLLIVGRAGSRACDWSGYALLCDNVQHFIEGGEPTEHLAEVVITATAPAARKKVAASERELHPCSSWRTIGSAYVGFGRQSDRRAKGSRTLQVAGG